MTNTGKARLDRTEGRAALTKTEGRYGGRWRGWGNGGVGGESEKQKMRSLAPRRGSGGRANGRGMRLEEKPSQVFFCLCLCWKIEKEKPFFGPRLASPLFSSFPWGGLRISHLGRRREPREGAGGKKEKKGGGHGVHGVHRARWQQVKEGGGSGQIRQLETLTGIRHEVFFLFVTSP